MTSQPQWPLSLTEDDLKKQAVEMLRSDFTILPEVEGSFLVDNTPVRIDFILTPKPHIKEQGFGASHIGLEVKAPNKEASGNKKKGLDICWQALTYAQSTFIVNQESIRPDFVVIFPHLKFFFDDNQGWIYVSSLIVRANVGVLEIDSYYKTWEMAFHSSRYFHSTRGPGAHQQAGTKRRVGTRK